MDFSAASLADPQSPPGEGGAGDGGLDLFSFVQPWLRGNICNQNKNKKEFLGWITRQISKAHSVLFWFNDTVGTCLFCLSLSCRHLVVINHIIISKHLGEGEGGREIRGSRQKMLEECRVRETEKMTLTDNHPLSRRGNYVSWSKEKIPAGTFPLLWYCRCTEFGKDKIIIYSNYIIQLYCMQQMYTE